MLIPKHLEEISEIIETSENNEVLKIKCKCSHTHFIVYEFCESDNANVKPGFNEIIRENDKLYLVKRNFFGKIVEKIECGHMFEKKQRRIIKVKCEKCGLEYVLFDITPLSAYYEKECDMDYNTRMILLQQAFSKLNKEVHKNDMIYKS